VQGCSVTGRGNDPATGHEDAGCTAAAAAKTGAGARAVDAGGLGVVLDDGGGDGGGDE
jgi:hypothetical protein